MSNTRKANISMDMENEMNRKAWQLLQDRDKNRFSSYSQTVIHALIRLLSDETSDIAVSSKDPEFLTEISETVERAAEKAIERTLPSFLAGYMACAAGLSPLGNEVRQIPANTSAVGENDEDAADDIDFDFLGLN